MGIGDLRLRLKAFRLRRFLFRDFRRKRRGNWGKKKPSWLKPVSHGFHVFDPKADKKSILDSVLVQREQINELEIWYFGVFQPQIGDGVNKYLQSHLFNGKLKESQIKKNSKDLMRKACLAIRGRSNEAHDAGEIKRPGSASALVIDGERLIISSMGDYRAVVCRDGSAYQALSGKRRVAKTYWSKRMFPARVLGRKAKPSIDGTAGQGKTEVAVMEEWIGLETEFVILASTGIWEVMKNQEAVNLIRHLEDPQAAAVCLAKEALSRMSKGYISCVVIRFD